MDHH